MVRAGGAVRVWSDAGCYTPAVLDRSGAPANQEVKRSRVKGASAVP